MPAKNPRGFQDTLERAVLAARRFQDAVKEARDDAMAVVFGHAYIHSMLQNIVSASVPHSEALSEGNVRYADLVTFALSLKAIPAEMEIILRKLGTYRNRYAHRIDYDMGDSDKQAFYDLIPERVKAQFLDNSRAVGNPLRRAIILLSDALISIALERVRQE